MALALDRFIPIMAALDLEVDPIVFGGYEPFMYAVLIWADGAAKFKCNRKVLERAQRLFGIRMIWEYRTVLEAVALVIAGTPSADLLAAERTEVF